jgi:hypothetical protein
VEGEEERRRREGEQIASSGSQSTQGNLSDSSSVSRAICMKAQISKIPIARC